MEHEIGASGVDDLVRRWITAKYQLTKSKRTGQIYTETMARFRLALARDGLDVLSPTGAVCDVARVFLGQPQRPGLRVLASATVNQRHAILSSFYTFAQRQGVEVANPLLRIEYGRRESTRKGTTLDEDTLRRRLLAIDTGTRLGRRDYALIEFAAFTGKRDHELRAINIENLFPRADGVFIQWTVLKGGKQQDRLYPLPHAHNLLAYLNEQYGPDWQREAPGTPVWCSLAYNGMGRRITRSGIVAIFKRRLGTTAVHTTRRLFAKMLKNANAPAPFVQQMLGHASLATTQRYFDEEDTATNPYAQAMAERVGLLGPPTDD